MFDGNTSEIIEYLDKYKDKFGEGFPLMQANGDSSIVKDQIKRCIDQNKKASELFPDIYGACEGKYI